MLWMLSETQGHLGCGPPVPRRQVVNLAEAAPDRPETYLEQADAVLPSEPGGQESVAGPTRERRLPHIGGAGAAIAEVRRVQGGRILLFQEPEAVARLEDRPQTGMQRDGSSWEEVSMGVLVPVLAGTSRVAEVHSEVKTPQFWFVKCG